MAKETKFELNRAVIIKDIQDKLRPKLITLSLGAFLVGFLLLIFIWMAFSSASSLEEFIFVLLIEVPFSFPLVILFFAMWIDTLVKYQSVKKENFIVLRDELAKYKEVPNLSFSPSAVTHRARFKANGWCAITKLDPTDPMIDLHTYEKFYVVKFKSKTPVLAFFGSVILAYSEKRYEYKE